jgi:hypothetical protein
MDFLTQIEDEELRQKVTEKVQAYLEMHPDQKIEVFQDIGYIQYIGTFIMMAVNIVTGKDVCPLLYNQGELTLVSTKEIERMYLWMVERKKKHGEI